MGEAHEIDLGMGHYARSPHFPDDFVQQIVVAFGKACGGEGYRADKDGGLVMTQERWDALRGSLRKVVDHNVKIASHAGDPDIVRAREERDRAKAGVVAVAGKLAEALGVTAPPSDD